MWSPAYANRLFTSSRSKDFFSSSTLIILSAMVCFLFYKARIFSSIRSRQNHAVGHDMLVLSDTVIAVNRLILNRRIPPRINDKNIIRLGQVQTWYRPL